MSVTEHTSKRERIAPDSAWGRFYKRKGLRAVTKSDRVPSPVERLIEWRIKYMSVPVESRNRGMA